MWPFKKAEISYYRVKKLGTKYYIERKFPNSYFWTTLHYWKYCDEFVWYVEISKSAEWYAKSLKEARDKISEFVPEYFEPFERDYDY
jgi:hypothetical protein